MENPFLETIVVDGILMQEYVTGKFWKCIAHLVPKSNKNGQEWMR